MSWASGKTALVTGGSQGIGHATAAALATLGAHVTVTGTRASFADYDAPIDGVAYVQADLADPAARAALAPWKRVTISCASSNFTSRGLRPSAIELRSACSCMIGRKDSSSK